MKIKSTFSNDDDNCVEVDRRPDSVVVTHSKQPENPGLTYTHDEWRAFIDGAKAGEFDLPS